MNMHFFTQKMDVWEHLSQGDSHDVFLFLGTGQCYEGIWEEVTRQRMDIRQEECAL